ncbi:MATE family efflux transporter [Roseovarius faecimaris]|uniref:Multidrug-efflux transporter n=1 Tax=Roseovarius faecimaris TaxID=2494550 RepID=A0A6I6IMJ8_9RHOB|nr:MATE family efflux transporter [Roseovarius faecimaris]QGX97825.1 MATE family efflux transporter [Roseovarius faecimaris]
MHSLTHHMRAHLRLGLPLIGSHIAQLSITLTDAMMLGWYDVETLGAQVLASEVFFVLFIFGSGFALAVMPMVASAEAAGDGAQVRRVTRMGAWASVLFGLAILPVFLSGRAMFLALGQEPLIADLGGAYLAIAGFGIIPALLVMVLKSFLSALERTQIVLWVTVGAVGLNMVLNYALIFGNWGMPELGIRGAAIASVAVNTASFLALALYAARKTPEHALFQRVWRPDWEAFGQVFRLGAPIGVTMLAESALFMASSIMMGWISALALAAHGIALMIASVTFMLYLGLANAATVRAGQAWGLRDIANLRQGAKAVTLLVGGIAVVTVTIFLTMPEPLIILFMDPDEPNREAVLAMGVVLMAGAALFQFMDAAQALALGLLRGVHDTKVPMWIAAFSYWCVGVTASYVLGFTLDLGGIGIWLGLAIGLAFAAVLLMGRFWIWTARSDRMAAVG